MHWIDSLPLIKAGDAFLPQRFRLDDQVGVPKLGGLDQGRRGRSPREGVLRGGQGRCMERSQVSKYSVSFGSFVTCIERRDVYGNVATVEPVLSNHRCLP